MGKWNAVSSRLSGRARIYPDLVRHPWDLGTMSATLAEVSESPSAALVAMIQELRGAGVTEALRDLHDPAWGDNFADYAYRMGTRPIADGFFEYADPTWETLRSEVAQAASDMDLIPYHDRSEVQSMAEGRWNPRGRDTQRPTVDREAGRGR